jgi:hypothetical protein
MEGGGPGMNENKHCGWIVRGPFIKNYVNNEEKRIQEWEKKGGWE